MRLCLSLAKFQDHTRPCWHASAARDLSQAESDWLADLTADDLYERISDVTMDKCPVAIIYSSSSDKAGLVLSVSTAESGWPRSTVRASADGTLCCRSSKCCSKGHKLRCEHCKLVAARLSDIEAELDRQDVMAVSAQTEELSAVAAERQSTGSQGQLQHQHPSCLCPLSRSLQTCTALSWLIVRLASLVSAC